MSKFELLGVVLAKEQLSFFKLKKKTISVYSNFSNYMRELYQWPGIAQTVDMPRIKQHYYSSHLAINPFGIVPSGPDQDLNAPHNRDRLSGAA